MGAFHEALNLLFTGDAGPIKAVWSHADDVTSMGPVGGMQVGWVQPSPPVTSRLTKNSAVRSMRRVRCLPHVHDHVEELTAADAVLCDVDRGNREVSMTCPRGATPRPAAWW